MSNEFPEPKERVLHLPAIPRTGVLASHIRLANDFQVHTILYFIGSSVREPS